MPHPSSFWVDEYPSSSTISSPFSSNSSSVTKTWKGLVILIFFGYCVSSDKIIPSTFCNSSEIEEKSLSFKNIVGCFGKIIKFEETEQNAYLISLKGLSRFKIMDSSLVKRGYISSNISTENFQNDLNFISNNSNFKFHDDKRLKTTLKSYLKFKKLESNWNYIKSSSNINLINQLSMICPFSVHEKQMLLESNTIDERYILLVSILQNTINPNEEQNEIKH